jgi:prepilin-type N-terminal cleavage/methylation domain-containing protein
MKGSSESHGFTMVELMLAVLIIGVLVAMAIPLLVASGNGARQKTCYANQRTIEGAAQTYQTSTGTTVTPGTVNPTHVLVSGGQLKSAPYCPLDGQTGYYGINISGTVTSFPPKCAAATDPTHGHY